MKTKEYQKTRKEPVAKEPRGTTAYEVHECIRKARKNRDSEC